MRAAMTRRQFVGAAAGAALAQRLATRTGPVRAQALTPLNVGMSFQNLDGVSAWIAKDKHFFDKYGLNVTIINIQGGPRTAAAMAGGDPPISLIGAADIIGAHSQGIPLQVIGGLINKFPFDFVVSKEITTPSQLKGTKGAISGIGGSSEFAARFALTKLGVDPKDVTLLQVGDEPSRLAALQSGQIQFSVFTAGLDLAAFDLGFKPLLKMYTIDQPYQHTGIGVNTNWAKTHGQLVDAFMRAIIAANVYVKNPLNVAAAVALIHQHLPIKEEHLKKGFQLYRDQIYTIYPNVTVPGMEFILRTRKIDKPVTDFYDNSYVETLQKANFAATAAQ